MYSKRTKRLSVVLYHTQIRSGEHDIVAYQVNDLISLGSGTVDTASDWLIENLDMVI